MEKEPRKTRFARMAKYKVSTRDLKDLNVEIKMKIKVKSVKFINFRAYNFTFYIKSGREIGRVQIKAPNYEIAKKKFKNLIL